MDITVSCTLDYPLNLQPIEVYSHQCPRSPTLLALGVCVLWRFLALNTKDLYGEAIRFAFSEFVEQHVTRIKNLIHLFPEDETVKDKETGKVSNFWTAFVPEFVVVDRARKLSEWTCFDGAGAVSVAAP